MAAQQPDLYGNKRVSGILTPVIYLLCIMCKTPQKKAPFNGQPSN